MLDIQVRNQAQYRIRVACKGLPNNLDAEVGVEFRSK